MAKKNRALRGDNFTKGEMWWYYALVYGLVWVAVAYNLVWGILSIFDMPLMYIFNDIDADKLNSTFAIMRADPSLQELGVPNLKTFNVVIGIFGILVALYTAFTGWGMLKFKKHAVGLFCLSIGIVMAINGVFLPIYYQVNIGGTTTGGVNVILETLQTAGAITESPSTLMSFLLGWNISLISMLITLFFFGDKIKLFKNDWFVKE